MSQYGWTTTVAVLCPLEDIAVHSGPDPLGDALGCLLDIATACGDHERVNKIIDAAEAVEVTRDRAAASTIVN